jgi:hypothetical protein
VPSLPCRRHPPGALSLALPALLQCSVAHSSPFFTLLLARNGCSHYGLMVGRFLLFHQCCCRFPLLRASCLLLKLERIAPLRPCCSPCPVHGLTSCLAQCYRVPSRRSRCHYRHHLAVRRCRTKTLPPQASSRRTLPVSVVVLSIACKFSSAAPPPRRQTPRARPAGHNLKFLAPASVIIVGEFRKTCHPRNVEAYEICVISFQGHRTHEDQES